MDFKKHNNRRDAVNIIHVLIGMFLFFIMIIIDNHQFIIFNVTGTFLILSIITTTTLYYFLSHNNSRIFLLNPAVDSSIHQNENIQQNFNSYNEVSSGVSRKRSKNDSAKKEQPTKSKVTPKIPYLEEVFAEFDSDFLQRAPIQTISVLSYFATSLFEKNNVDEVLWDIVENCIAYLQLEDCVIYMLDKEKQYLIQKAAFGNKNNGEKKIVSPIKIKVGNGIVGNVAKSGKYKHIKDVTSNSSYIVDDANRMSELSVPIYIGDMVIGVLDSEHSEKDFFTEDHIFLFHLISKLTEKKLKQICNNSSSCNLSNDNVYFKELEFLMKEAKLYRDPNLGLTKVAQKLKISSNYLSQLVNKLTGKNFADYINTFRVEDAKSKLTNNNFMNYTIVGIGLESGFNSKSTFYSSFKKIVGISPSIYRKTS